MELPYCDIDWGDLSSVMVGLDGNLKNPLYVSDARNHINQFTTALVYNYAETPNLVTWFIQSWYDLLMEIIELFEDIIDPNVTSIIVMAKMEQN